ncbi:MAG: hypothetical protein HKN87_10325 [Saprospiraceae bacterium]|nr:hypothetical protein [Saprospiraceae bacterium]
MSDKVALSFVEICYALRNFKLPETDVVIGIGRGGIIPASLVAFQLKCDLQIVRVNYRNDDNTPVRTKPTFLDEFALDLPVDSRILLVDDVSVSGKTLEVVKEKISQYKVQTFVLKGQGDHVLFPDIKSCVHWPWKEDVMQVT